MSGWIPMARSSLTLCWVSRWRLLRRGGDGGGGGGGGRHSVTCTSSVALAKLVAQLADGLKEGKGFDVADRAANLYDYDVHGGRLARSPATRRAAALISIVDMRDTAHLAEMIATALSQDDLLVDPAAGQVVGN